MTYSSTIQGNRQYLPDLTPPIYVNDAPENDLEDMIPKVPPEEDDESADGEPDDGLDEEGWEGKEGFPPDPEVSE